MAATYQLWSWDDRSSRWLAVSQGAKRDMDEQLSRRYATAAREQLDGSAFVVSRGAPLAPPDQIGVHVVPGGLRPPKVTTIADVPAIADAMAAEVLLDEQQEGIKGNRNDFTQSMAGARGDVATARGALCELERLFDVDLFDGLNPAGADIAHHLETAARALRAAWAIYHYETRES